MLRIDHSCRFPHDRVQEAAYSLVPESDRAGLHLEIGRRLWARTPPAERAREDVRDRDAAEPRGVLDRLARGARERGRDQSVGGEAGQGIRGLCLGAHLPHRRLRPPVRGPLAGTLRAHLRPRAQSGRMRAPERQRRRPPRARLSALSRRARTLADRAAVTGAEIEIYHTSHRSPRAVEAALGYLRQVGIEWTPHPTETEVAEEYASLWRALGDRSIESLVDLPAVSDPDCAGDDGCPPVDHLARLDHRHEPARSGGRAYRQAQPRARKQRRLVPGLRPPGHDARAPLRRLREGVPLRQARVRSGRAARPLALQGSRVPELRGLGHSLDETPVDRARADPALGHRGRADRQHLVRLLRAHAPDHAAPRAGRSARRNAEGRRGGATPTRRRASSSWPTPSGRTGS